MNEIPSGISANVRLLAARIRPSTAPLAPRVATGANARRASGGIRGIHPLLAMAAVALTAVCAIAGYQMLVPQNAHSADAPPAVAAAAPPGSYAPPVPAAPPQVLASAAPAVAACGDCGQITNIRAQRQAGQGSGLGAVAGGVLGGVLGHQAGGGSGKKLLTLAGAVGGAFAGNQVEKQAKAQTIYLVDVRMPDGSVRTIQEASPPSLAIGAKVHVSGNLIRPL